MYIYVRACILVRIVVIVCRLMLFHKIIHESYFICLHVCTSNVANTVRKQKQSAQTLNPIPTTNQSKSNDQI